MPKESRRKHANSSHERHSHRDRRQSPRSCHRRSSSGNQYSLVIKNCENMLSDIRVQIDQLREEFQHKKTRLVSTSSCSATIMNRSNICESSHSVDRLHRLPPLSNGALLSPITPERFKSVDKMVEHLKSKSTIKSSVTRDAIDSVMSASSTCQLQLLEISLQCPLSKSKISVPVKTIKCQHLGCFDAKSFLSIMMTKNKPKCWKCPICSACAELDWLVVDGFLQEIINTTPSEAMKVEFTSSSNWKIKEDNGTTILRKGQSPISDIECIDLTYSPLAKKSVVIDLTHSP